MASLADQRQDIRWDGAHGAAGVEEARMRRVSAQRWKSQGRAQQHGPAAPTDFAAPRPQRGRGQRGLCMMQCDGVGAPARHLRSAAEFGSLSHQPHAVRAALGALGHLSELQLDHAANRPDDQGAYLVLRHVRG